MLTHTYVHPARHRAQLTLADVSLMRGATPVLNHVDLTVTAQSRIAIVGENGRGKSTLLMCSLVCFHPIAEVSSAQALLASQNRK